MKRTSWLPIPADSDFSIYNLPFGIFSTASLSPRPGIALGDYVVHLAAAYAKGYLPAFGHLKPALEMPTLNSLLAISMSDTLSLRRAVQDFFSGTRPADFIDSEVLVPISEARLHLPVEVGDYTDFYSSEYHATNVGALFRPDNPLLPNWKHMPIGYHGRSSSIVVSGTDFVHPHGQVKAPTAELPSYSPSRQVDMEVETGFILGKGTEMGQTLSPEEAKDYIFGMVLFNDWSARDIQSWEYQPLGPFLGKNFCSSMSPWVVTMEALQPFKVPLPKQEPGVLDYLKMEDDWLLDVHLTAEFELSSGASKVIAQTNQKYLYWSMNQQLAHHTVNGCPMRIGDLLASGTISGPTPDSLGCLLESTKRGQFPVEFASGEKRTFMLDGDRITLRGYAQKEGMRVGFGEVTGRMVERG